MSLVQRSILNAVFPVRPKMQASWPWPSLPLQRRIAGTPANFFRHLIRIKQYINFIVDCFIDILIILSGFLSANHDLLVQFHDYDAAKLTGNHIECINRRLSTCCQCIPYTCYRLLNTKLSRPEFRLF